MNEGGVKENGINEACMKEDGMNEAEKNAHGVCGMDVRAATLIWRLRA